MAAHKWLDKDWCEQQRHIPPKDGFIIYTVSEGDSLAAIARKYYGDMMGYIYVINDNDINDGCDIFAGMQLYIREN